MKTVFTILLISAFISIAVFGLFVFSHTSHIFEAPMTNCPYAENSHALCSDTFDHIYNWQQFSNVIVSSLIIFSLILGIFIYLFYKQNFLKQTKSFLRWKYYIYENKNLFIFREKINKWLSLFENSPSLS